MNLPKIPDLVNDRCGDSSASKCAMQALLLHYCFSVAVAGSTRYLRARERLTVPTCQSTLNIVLAVAGAECCTEARGTQLLPQLLNYPPRHTPGASFNEKTRRGFSCYKVAKKGQCQLLQILRDYM